VSGVSSAAARGAASLIEDETFLVLKPVSNVVGAVFNRDQCKLGKHLTSWLKTTFAGFNFNGIIPLNHIKFYMNGQPCGWATETIFQL
jgi:hypothetical protein